ncbi:anti-sigma factor family protein [Pseudonocardia sp. CA-142604]|uniref:anti-sigma factor family protein n=1 Tax=Pseudonocardia sp. CA-142604 TaxID=3240024 RepID=UPI003D8C712C
MKDGCRRTDLGAYLVGSLDPAERAEVEQHLATCIDCRSELTELAPLPGVLGRIDAAEARDRLLTPSPDLLSRALAAVDEHGQKERHRLLRWKMAAAAAAVVAVLAGVLPQLITNGTNGTPMAVMTGVTAAGVGTMHQRAWGTAVHLELSGLPPASGYRAYATARDGRTEVAANWGASPDGRATVIGTTAIPRNELASIDIRTVDGRRLLTLPC